MQRNPHSYQIATGYRTFYSLSLIYQPITKKRLFLLKKVLYEFDALLGFAHIEKGFVVFWVYELTHFLLYNVLVA